MRDWRHPFTGGLTRLRRDGVTAVLWSTRITVAAVAGYVAGTFFFEGTQPLLAPLTAMLVVQVTPVSLLASGLDRVVAVVAGVLLAVLFASVAPLEWWTLGLLIFASITVGQVLRLRDNLLEVAISAMLVLGVGSFYAESAAWQRITETLVGAAVGVVVNLVFPPKVATASAGQAIDGVADALGELLTDAADDLKRILEERGNLGAAADSWLGDARRVTHEIPQAGAALLQAEQGRRLNVRAAVTPDVGPGLRQGLEALEHSAISIRTMMRVASDTVRAVDWPLDHGQEETLLGVADAFRRLAAGVDTFGQLVQDEAKPRNVMSASDVDALRESLSGLHDTRARLEDLAAAGVAPELADLNGAVLATVARVIQELDLDERIRRQVRLRRRTRTSLAEPVTRRRRRRQATLPPPSAEDETEVLPPVRDEPDEPDEPAR